MTMSIWKFKLRIAGRQSIAMPIGARVLCVQSLRNEPTMLALVDPTQPNESRTFHVYGTGFDVPELIGTYVGTVQTDGGAFAWHVFELSSGAQKS